MAPKTIAEQAPLPQSGPGLDPNLVTLPTKSGASITGQIVERFEDGSVDIQFGDELFRMRKDGTFRFRDPRIDTAVTTSTPERTRDIHLKTLDQMVPEAQNIFLGKGEVFDEGAFNQWYAEKAKLTGLDLNPDDPKHKYDYRAAFSAGAEPQLDLSDGQYHWPSQFKAPDHPNRFVNGLDTITGESHNAKP
jgi:hypothetical protein